MASLQLSNPNFTTTTTTTHSNPSNSRQIFAKPSHFIVNAKPRSSNRLRISCSSAENPKTPSSSESSSSKVVDRRNVLLGLGGLYGAAAATLSTTEALADPIDGPDMSKCSTPVDVQTKQPFKDKDNKTVQCCLKNTGNIIEYKIPPVTTLKTRPSAHRASPEYIYKYNKALDRMRRLPKDDPRSFASQANIHCAYCNTVYKQSGGDKDLQVHFSWIFFPFHRWYLYFYERILGKLIDDPNFAIPFWNWDNPKGMTMPPMFVDRANAPALYDVNRNPASLPPNVIDLGMTGNTDPLQVVANNLTIMNNEMIRGNSTVYDFMGQPYCKDSDANMGYQGASERGSHTAVHVAVGDPKQPNHEDMGNFYSAGKDPVFYCHHGNVDRMWTLWRYYLPNPNIPVKDIPEKSYKDTAFLFYDEDGNQVKVYARDCVDNRKLGYDYERVDLPWIDYRPPPQTAQAKVRRISTDASKAKDAATFPLELNQISRVIVPKTTKGPAKESLVIDITVDTSKLLKFDVFVNDEDDNVTELDKAAYAGTYAQVPQTTGTSKIATTSLRLRLTDLYKDMDVADDEDVVVTLVPRHQGAGVTIGGIKIIEEPTTAT